VHDVALGHETKMVWNPEDAWVVSDGIVNPPIIDEETFTAVRQVMGGRARDGRRISRTGPGTGTSCGAPHIAECDHKLARYKMALESMDDTTPRL
jgi:hypothetical protein